MLIVHKGWFGWYVYSKIELDRGYCYLKLFKVWNYGLARSMADLIARAKGGEAIEVRQLSWLERI